MNEKLKPCPFCGSDNWDRLWDGSHFQMLFHKDDCYLNCDGNPEMILDGDAIHQARWNRRAEVSHEQG